MSFEIRTDEVDVQEIMRLIRHRIEEKKKGVYSEDEIREIAEHKLQTVLLAREFNVNFAQELQKTVTDDPFTWDLNFEEDSLFASSTNPFLQKVRGWLRPIQKLFWNPGPLVWSLVHQTRYNRQIHQRLTERDALYLHLLHNYAVETTRLNLEIQDLRNRVLQLQGQQEQIVRREKTLESMVVYRADDESKGEKAAR